jgi:hypothetical protein
MEIDWLFSQYGGAAKVFPQQYRQFQEEILTKSERNNDSEKHPLAALKGYHARLFGYCEGDPNGKNNIKKTIEEAIQAWRKWEMLMTVAHKVSPSLLSSLPSSTEQPQERQQEIMSNIQQWDTNHKESSVIFARKEQEMTSWNLLRQEGSEDNNVDSDAFQLAQNLRQGISQNGCSLHVSTESLPRIIEIGAPVQSIPSQVLLTCHFSLYREYCMGGIDILNPLRMQKLNSVRCIAVQGGNDRICPPDTALDLLDAWPASSKGFELRMPLYAGHSMYDPFLTHEVVCATDLIADEFIMENEKLSGL